MQSLLRLQRYDEGTNVNKPEPVCHTAPEQGAVENQSFSEKPHGEAPPARVDEMLRSMQDDAERCGPYQEYVAWMWKNREPLAKKASCLTCSHMPDQRTDSRVIGP